VRLNSQPTTSPPNQPRRRPTTSPPMNHRIYLDHAATSPLRPEAFDAMRPFLTGPVGNPASSHWAGRRARHALESAPRARRRIARRRRRRGDLHQRRHGGEQSRDLRIGRRTAGASRRVAGRASLRDGNRSPGWPNADSRWKHCRGVKSSSLSPAPDSRPRCSSITKPALSFARVRRRPIPTRPKRWARRRCRFALSE